MHRPDFFRLKSIEYDGDKASRKRGLEKGGNVQAHIDSLVLRLCEPKVPKDTNALIESGIINTDIGSGEVVYNTPYARRWYYMPAVFQEAPERGNYWFERMKQESRNDILASAAREAGARPS